MAAQTDYAVGYVVDNKYVYVNGIYTTYVTLSDSFDDAIKCTTQTEAENFALIVDGIDSTQSSSPIVIQRVVEYTTINNP